MTSMSGVVQFTHVKYQPIESFLRKFDVESQTRRAHSSAAGICPVTVQWLRPAPANVEALRQFPFLESNYNKPSVDVVVTRF